MIGWTFVIWLLVQPQTGHGDVAAGFAATGILALLTALAAIGAMAFAATFVTKRYLREGVLIWMAQAITAATVVGSITLIGAILFL